MIIKVRSKFQGPQFTVLYEAKLQVNLQGHIYTVSLFCGCCDISGERKRLPPSTKEKQKPQETQIHKSLAILTYQISLAKSQRFTISVAPNGLNYILDRICWVSSQSLLTPSASIPLPYHQLKDHRKIINR